MKADPAAVCFRRTAHRERQAARSCSSLDCGMSMLMLMLMWLCTAHSAKAKQEKHPNARCTLHNRCTLHAAVDHVRPIILLAFISLSSSHHRPFWLVLSLSLFSFSCCCVFCILNGLDRLSFGLFKNARWFLFVSMIHHGVSCCPFPLPFLP